MPNQVGSDFFGSLSTGIFIGLCLVALLYLAQILRYWYFLKHKYHKAIFSVFTTQSSEDAKYQVTCEVKSHSIFFTAKDRDGVLLYEGEFIMNPLNLKFGEGYYHRVLSHQEPGKSDGYGFMKVLIKNDWTFLVEEQVSAQGQELSHPAIIWKRV